MNVLFIHQSFPGQFKFLAPELVRLGHKVVALTHEVITGCDWQGVRVVPYQTLRSSTSDIHPWVIDFETNVIYAESCFRAALRLREEGFVPDVIVAHPGWGESLFLKDVWPSAKLGIYCEFYYQADGADIDFDPEFPDDDPAQVCRLRVKNVNNTLHFGLADSAIAPTLWQASTFPEPFRSRITVVHDGVDTGEVCPNQSVNFSLVGAEGGISLTRRDEVITFVSRNLEPYRGFHVFMRTLPEILKRRPNARVLIVGGDEVSYGSKPDKERYGERNWRDILMDEVSTQISDVDRLRIHFLGRIPYEQFLWLLQLSTVHVYLTYPFVLSWSLIEAMSTGCAIVASDTPPVREAISHGETGRLVSFFGASELADEICALLDNPLARASLGANARRFAKRHYDLKSICLPKQLAWFSSLASRI